MAGKRTRRRYSEEFQRDAVGRMHRELLDRGYEVSENTVSKLMSEAG